MKNYLTKIALLIIIVISLTNVGCRHTKSIADATDRTHVIPPLSESKYKSDKDYFRATQTGNSLDESTAKKRALLNANAELAASIQKLIKSVSLEYTNDLKVQENKEVQNGFEEQILQVVKLTLADVQTIGEELYVEKKDKSYTYYICVEISKKSILDGLDNNISKNQRLRYDYNKEKFEGVFNTEMDKLEKERNENK
jgi:predicted transcriptional regulator YdeE